MTDATTVNKMLEQAPLPQLVENLGVAIANAQLELDKHSIQITELLARPLEETGVLGERSMLELGFTPTFYHFTETTISAKVAFSSTQTTEVKAGASISAGYSIFSASVNASYSNKYSFTADGSSEIKTKIVSLPPPAPLSQLIQAGLKKKAEERA